MTDLHTYDGAGEPITIRVGPMGSAVAYRGHLEPGETGEFADPPGHVDLTLRCPACGRRADVCFDHGGDWKKRGGER